MVYEHVGQCSQQRPIIGADGIEMACLARNVEARHRCQWYVRPTFCKVGLRPCDKTGIRRLPQRGVEAVGGFDEKYFGGEEIILSRALKRQGRFVVLTQSVLTSGRKLRTHSAREMWGGVARVALRGPRGVRQREGMDLWYAPRRQDPGQDN